MPVTREMLLGELKELQRLTAFEQAVATVRRTQAASGAVAEELADNAGQAAERLTLLGAAVRGVGGTPDLVGPVLGKLTALVQTQVNQVQTLQGALLGDLALEHQLRERARYARTLAVTLGETSVVPVLDRLDTAHTQTIAWLERRLAEVGRTGTSALKATPVQEVFGVVRTIAGAPLSYAASGINWLGGLFGTITRQTPATLAGVAEAAGTAADAVADSVRGTVADSVQSAASAVASSAEDTATTVTDTVGEFASSVEDTATTVTDTVGEFASTFEDTATTVTDTVGEFASSAASSVEDATEAVADTAADVAADVAADAAADAGTDTVADAADPGTATAADNVPETRQEAADQAEETTHEVLAATGGDDVPDVKPPFAGYERLSGDSIMRHVDDTDDVQELRVLLAFEQAHKARKGVLKAAQDRLTAVGS